MIRPSLLAIAALVLAGPCLAADDLAGSTWLRDSGASRIRFEPCGQALCGTVVWLKNPGGPSKVGQRVFIDMKPAGAGAWAGQAFNPEDGKTYSGKMSLSGTTLTTAGCVFGGLICKSVSWSRVN